MFKNYYRDNPRMPYGLEEHEQYVAVDWRTQILVQLPEIAWWESHNTRLLTIDGVKRYVKFEIKPFGHWVAVVTHDDYFTKVKGHWQEVSYPEKRVELDVDRDLCDLPF